VIGPRLGAVFVHVYTASGVLLALAAAMEVCSAEPDVRYVFLALAVAVLVDATDGPLARRAEVKRWMPSIDGRTIDDIVDYLTFTFVPLLLVWRMGWLPEPAVLYVGPALVASLFGFANTAAKDESRGFFLGFPSYWNVVAFYAGFSYYLYGPWVNAAVFLLLSLLTVMPVRFLYPNLTPRPWRMPVILGALLWLGLMLWLLRDYPEAPEWIVWLSLIYPAFYFWLSYHLATRRVRADPL
jgi:phosphatidylcholine synthase